MDAARQGVRKTNGVTDYYRETKECDLCSGGEKVKQMADLKRDCVNGLKKRYTMWDSGWQAGGMGMMDDGMIADRRWELPRAVGDVSYVWER